jgi:hypothetical protein
MRNKESRVPIKQNGKKDACFLLKEKEAHEERLHEVS